MPNRVKWRSSASIKAVKVMLDRLIQSSLDGAVVEVPIGLARSLSEVCAQASPTEEGHEFFCG
jgi:hypothetical protein